MRAAYVHVLADAATSVLAIVALACGYYFGLGILDPVSGLVGAFVIASWSYGLIRDSAMVLLDADADPKHVGRIKSAISEERNGRAGRRPASVAAGAGPSRADRLAGLADAISAEAIKAPAPALSRPVPCHGRSRGLRRLHLSPDLLS